MNKIFLSIGSINIYWYSILILLSILIGYLIVRFEAKRIKVNSSFIIDLFVGIIFWGIIGARLYFVIFSFSDYKDNLLSIIYIWEGGLAIYGGIIASIIYIIYFCKKRELNILLTTDLLSVSLILAQAIGRWGNFINQEAYGPETTLTFLKSLHLPDFIINGMNIGGLYYQPTFLYESIWCLSGFIILLIIRYLLKGNRVGTQTFIYFIWYGIGRFLIESLRSDSLFLGDYKISQIISLILVIIGLLGLISNRKKEKYLEKGEY